MSVRGRSGTTALVALAAFGAVDTGRARWGGPSPSALVEAVDENLMPRSIAINTSIAKLGMVVANIET